MIIRNATQVGNTIIRKRSKPIRMVKSAETRKLVKNLTDSMRYHDLVGMAAPQIGVNLRVFVTEVRKTKTRNPKLVDPLRVFINPRIVRFSNKKALIWEGCGSVARSNLFSIVRRPAEVTVVALDQKGNKFRLSAKGLLARIIQHETDHLDGKVFLDRISDTKTLMSREEYVKKA